MIYYYHNYFLIFLSIYISKLLVQKLKGSSYLLDHLLLLLRHTIDSVVVWFDNYSYLYSHVCISCLITFCYIIINTFIINYFNLNNCIFFILRPISSILYYLANISIMIFINRISDITFKLKILLLLLWYFITIINTDNFELVLFLLLLLS